VAQTVYFARVLHSLLHRSLNPSAVLLLKDFDPEAAQTGRFAPHQPIGFGRANKTVMTI
jgi:hypothetical protein